jgi:hypothetical protein
MHVKYCGQGNQKMVYHGLLMMMEKYIITNHNLNVIFALAGIFFHLIYFISDVKIEFKKYKIAKKNFIILLLLLLHYLRNS